MKEITIDKVIKHCEQVAETNERIISYFGWDSEFTKHCKETAEEYRTVAKWLNELQHLRNITEFLRDSIWVAETRDDETVNGDIIKWAENELTVKEVDE